MIGVVELMLDHQTIVQCILNPLRSVWITIALLRVPSGSFEGMCIMSTTAAVVQKVAINILLAYQKPVFGDILSGMASSAFNLNSTTVPVYLVDAMNLYSLGNVWHTSLHFLINLQS